MAPPPETWFFDIETGGFKARKNPLLSIARARETGKPITRYAEPTKGTYLSAFAQNKVLGQMGGVRTSEKAVLLDFLKVLETAPTETQLVGWNIGYSPIPQDINKAGGFDVPFLVSRAKEYGLQERYQKAFQRLKIRDEGAIWSYRIAKNISGTTGRQLLQEGRLEKNIFMEAVGYTKKAAQLAHEQGLRTESEIAEALSRSNIRFAGWKQESTFKLLFGHMAKGRELLSRAHEAGADTEMLRMLSQYKRREFSRDFTERLGKEILENKLVSSLKGVRPTDLTRYHTALTTAREWKIEKGFLEKVTELSKSSGVSLRDIKAGRGVLQTERVVGGGLLSGRPRIGRLTGILGKFEGVAASHFGKIGLGVGALALLLSKPGSWFDEEDNSVSELFRFKSTSPQKLAKVKPWEGKESLETPEEKLSFLKKSLYLYGERTDTGHERLVFPKTFLSAEQLENLGFVSTAIAVPEAGQDTFSSYRHPYMTYHIHSHEDEWTMHKDEHEASTMLLEKFKRERKAKTDKDLSLLEEGAFTVQKTIEGLPHLIGEGVPGMAYYVTGQLFSSQDLAERVKEETSSAYMNFMYGNQFSAKDDEYNTIEGLYHGGYAGRMRRGEIHPETETHFGSGARKLLENLLSIKSIESGGKAVAKGTGLEALYKGTFAGETFGKALEEVMRRGEVGLTWTGDIVGAAKLEGKIQRIATEGLAEGRFGRDPFIGPTKEVVGGKAYKQLSYDKPSVQGELFSRGLTPAEVEAVTPVVGGHEMSEIYHGIRKQSKGMQDKIGRMGSHQTMAVIGDELLMAAGIGPEAFQAIKKYRLQEAEDLLSIWGGAAKGRKGILGIGKKAPDMEAEAYVTYAKRSQKIIESFERKQLPKFYWYNTPQNTRVGSTSSFFGNAAPAQAMSSGSSGGFATKQQLKRKQKMQAWHKKAQIQRSVFSLRPGKRHRGQAGRIIT